MKMASNVNEEPMPVEAINPMQTSDITYATTETAMDSKNEVTNNNNNNNNNSNNNNNNTNSNKAIITINHKNVNTPQEAAALTSVENNEKDLPETKTAFNNEAVSIVIKNLEPSLAAPKLTEHAYHDAADEHGGDETTRFLKAELNTTQQQIQQQQQFQQKQRLRSASSTLDATVSRNPSTAAKHEKKIGHRRVDEGGEVTYKRIQSKQIMGSIQLGIQHTVGSLASKPKRDLLMNDFWEIETISFPPDGSSITPAHHYSDFKFKVYAPIAFRYFRDLFGIAPDDFLMSMCAAPLRELSNPGASGSLFYLTDDDEFIIKTVQKKEGDFLQKLLPGYYMNLSQNPRTLLPKFFGLYCFNYNTKNVRLIAMNNILPSDIKMHAKYDLKGSTFGRKASKQERQKSHPVFKDLDFMDHHPNGIFLETDKYNALMKTIQRDCMVLESFQIMDYSLLVGIHNLDLAAKEKREERIRNARAKLQRNEEADISVRVVNDVLQDKMSHYNPAAAVAAAAASVSAIGISAASTSNAAGSGTALNRSRSMNRQRLVAHSTAMESITADMDVPLEEDDDVPAGGIPARSENDERLILYIGIIDILQSYRLEKKLEHTFKSIIYNGDTVSVCRPSFYAHRFQNFMGKTVFKKTPTFPLKHSPSKRKTSTASGMTNNRTPVQRTPSQSISGPSQPSRIQLNMGTSTPPPAFDDISEEELTATSSSGYNRASTKTNSLSQLQMYQLPSYTSSNHRSLSGDYSDDDDLASCSSVRSPVPRRSPNLSKTSVQVTSIGMEDSQDMTNQAKNKQIIVINNDNNNGMNSKKLIKSNDNVGDVVVIGHRGDEVDQLKTVSSTKTAILNPISHPTYTSTLVVNDVVR